MIRFFLKNKEIKNKTVMFDADQSKKIRKVLRMKIGDKVEVFDNNAWKYSVELEKITNNFSVGKIIDQEMIERKTNITLYQALPKNLKIEFIIQKCTELGIDKIVFWEADFSQVNAKGISAEKVKRWKKIAIEATEQCGRVFIPEIELYTDKITDEQEKFENTFVLNQNGKILVKYFDFTGSSFLKNQGLEAVTISKLLDTISFFVGPEGGFSQKEMDKFEELNVKSIKISENILRSETAGMAFLAQIELLRSNL